MPPPGPQTPRSCPSRSPQVRPHHRIRNSLSCKLMNVQACMKDNNEKIFDEQQISLLTKAPPKDTAALDKRSVLAKANSKGSGRYKPSTGQIPKVGENDE